MTTTLETAAAQYRVTGMDCGNCAAKIETGVRGLSGVQDVRVSIASELMTLHVDDPGRRLPEVEHKVRDLGYHLERIDAAKPEADRGGSVRTPPAYRRALWIVVLLNVGYGLVEIGAGLFGRSQALQADALDFLGDGLITFLGLLAIGWSLAWRARAALIQGIFLAVLGLAVLVSTAYRVLVLNEPNAEVMGLFGAVALVVNVVAAIVLIPHRAGDANARAVWLFSRNDALGNLAVVIAAGLVFWTRTPWPDLVVAFVIAGLFLQSAWSIVGHARRDLREGAADGPRAVRF